MMLTSYIFHSKFFSDYLNSLTDSCLNKWYLYKNIGCLHHLYHPLKNRNVPIHFVLDSFHASGGSGTPWQVSPILDLQKL